MLVLLFQGDNPIAAGVRTTAPVVVGAALVMAGVFAVFAMADMSNMRQLGIELTVAVLLDATGIRLVLLPACIRLLGDRCFGTPRVLGAPDVA